MPCDRTETVLAIWRNVIDSDTDAVTLTQLRQCKVDVIERMETVIRRQ